MTYHDRLQAEIATKVQNIKDAGQALRAAWIAHDICRDHVDGLVEEGEDDNDDREFWQHGGYRTVREESRKFINKLDGETKKDREPAFPGFDHVQDYYPVERDGDEVHIPALDLSDEELDTKADLYDVMGATCLEHARELRRFKTWRRTLKPKTA